MRTVLSAAIVLSLVVASSFAGAQAPGPKMQVYKSATCGCCVKWVELLRKEGFTVTATDVPDIQAVKTKHQVPDALASCHTTIVDGYVVEGHVPAADVKRLLKERPKVMGIAVPGMPMGSPGMESPNPQPYKVVTFDKKGPVAVFSTHP